MLLLNLFAQIRTAGRDPRLPFPAIPPEQPSKFLESWNLARLCQSPRVAAAAFERRGYIAQVEKIRNKFR